MSRIEKKGQQPARHIQVRKIDKLEGGILDEGSEEDADPRLQDGRVALKGTVVQVQGRQGPILCNYLDQGSLLILLDGRKGKVERGKVL